MMAGTERWDLVIRHGLVANASGVQAVDVAVRNGRIGALLEPGIPVSADAVLEVPGLYVLPGCIDPHMHLWEAGLCAAPDFVDATRTAIAGGVTTIIDHPLTSPEVVSVAVLEAKASLGERTSYCDFALFGGVTASNQAFLRDMWEAGAAGFKIFMCRSGSAVEELDDALLLNALRAIGSFGGIALFHAENQRLMDFNEARLKAAGRRDHVALAEWRPPEAEAEAINRASFFCGITGARGVFVHTSVPEGCELVQAARERGAHVAVETCPHYLYLSTKDLAVRGPWVKCQPPLRDPERVTRLWEHLRGGRIAMVGSDHGPVDPALKERGRDDMWTAQGGMPAIETMVPLLLEAVVEGHLTLEQVVSLTSTSAARWYGLYPGKGVIDLGTDADFTIVDLGTEWTVRGRDLVSPCGWTPFEDWRLRASVRYTILRGRLVAQDGRPTDAAYAGYGRFLPARRAGGRRT